jgi:hypothetical protein
VISSPFSSPQSCFKLHSLFSFTINTSALIPPSNFFNDQLQLLAPSRSFDLRVLLIWCDALSRSIPSLDVHCSARAEKARSESSNGPSSLQAAGARVTCDRATNEVAHRHCLHIASCCMPSTFADVVSLLLLAASAAFVVYTIVDAIRHLLRNYRQRHATRTAVQPAIGEEGPPPAPASPPPPAPG